MYNKALHESGYETYLKYRKEAKTTKAISNRRRRNIVWFNPPYSDNVETNIGHEFLNLITKHFPKHHRLHKICNKNNIKINYSCMPNMSAVILRHNKKLLSALPKTDRPPTADSKCNCRIKTACPLDGECKQKSICFVLFAIFILHSRESELYRYTLDRKSALAWELPFSRFMGHLSST